MEILNVPEEGRFGQPKYSTLWKLILRCICHCSYIQHCNVTLLSPTFRNVTYLTCS